MRLLFVHAHPSPTSFSTAQLRTATAAARSVGQEARVIDLYAEAFNPSLSLEEWQNYADPDAIDPSLEPHIEALRWAEAVVFLFPTWWSGQPAILKGWLDRVWRPGIAFHADSNTLRPGLPNIRLIGVITTLGASQLTWSWLLGAPGRKQLLRGLRMCTNKRTRTFWLPLYNIDTTTPATRAAFLDKISTTIIEIAV